MPTLMLTRFYVPQLRPGHITRPRLVARLSTASALRLTLLSAPPGFGKTALLSEWVSHETGAEPQRFRVAWLSLYEGDNDLAGFWMYVISALQTAVPGLGEGALAMLQSPEAPPIEVILTALVNELAAVPPLVLVLDDYHVVAASAIHTSLTFFIEHLPPAVHIVMAGRADPALPLARWRARGCLAELRVDDLRFEMEEAAALLHQSVAAPLTADEVALLMLRTEGWAAGLQLAALSLQGRADPGEAIVTFSGSHRFVLDYLIGEVLDRQPEPVQAFLLQTALLRRLTGPLCDRMLERTDSQSVLEQLEQANLFIVPLDGERRWYRYHHLFADLLIHRFWLTMGEQAAGLHSRAAEWYAAEGLFDDAIYHAVKARQPERAADWVEQNTMPLLARGELVTLRGWLQALPASLFESRPRLTVTQAWVQVLTGQARAAEDSLRAAEPRIDPAMPEMERNSVVGQAAAIRAYIVLQQGDRTTGEALARQALALVPEGEGVVRSFALFLLGTARLLADDGHGAERALAVANALALACGNDHLALNTSRMLARFAADRGHLHQTLEMCQADIRRATGPSGRLLPVAAGVCTTVGMLRYELNDLPTAEKFLSQAQELAEQWGNADVALVNTARQGWLCHARGDDVGAQSALDRGRQLLEQRQLTPGTAEVLQHYQVRLWVAAGDLGSAERWAQESGLAPDSPCTYLNYLLFNALARVHLALGRYAEALGALAAVRRWAETQGFTGVLIGEGACESVALLAQGQTPRALESLEGALHLATAEGYVRTFVDEGEPMCALLVELQKGLAKRSDTPGTVMVYLNQLLRAFPGATEPSVTELAASVKASTAPGLVENLSERELELLRLIADGLSNQEIADRLVISVGTVKAHTSNIYRKLDVRARTQAVARAKKLGLL